MIAFGPYGSHFGGNHFKFQGLKFARALHFKDIVYISPKKVMFWTTFFIIINMIFFLFMKILKLYMRFVLIGDLE